MPSEENAPRPSRLGARPRPAARAAAALALAAPLVAFPGPEALLAAAAAGALAGLFDFLSRSKKKAEPLPGAERAGREEAEDAPIRAETGEKKATGKMPGEKKKDDAPPRPRPRRSDYTGQRVGIHVPGRKAEIAGPPAPAPPPPEEKQSEPEGAVCPDCKQPSLGPGRYCAEHESTRFVTEVGNLISSLKTREVNMLPAERYLFQARSALAVSAWRDVARLAAQAEAAAREQEADFEESQRILSRCEEAIATAIETGKNTLAAEKAFRRATMLFKEGKYTDCMEEAVLIPALIMDRPRPRVIPAGGGARTTDSAGPPQGGEPPSGAPPPAAAAPAPEPAAARCQSCGERMVRGAGECPACGRSAAPAGQPAWQEGGSCAGCGEPLEPAWRVCPACNRPTDQEPGGAGGTCRSCGREVLPSWTICPFCDAKLRDGRSAVKVRKGFSRPEKSAPEIPPALREKGVLAQIEEVDRLLDEAGRRDLDVRKARNLLELAVGFTRSGNYDKGERYVRKAKNVAETLLTLE